MYGSDDVVYVVRVATIQLQWVWLISTGCGLKAPASPTAPARAYYSHY